MSNRIAVRFDRESTGPLYISIGRPRSWVLLLARGDVASGLFVRARFPNDKSARRVTRREHLGRALPSLPPSPFGLIYGPVKEEEIVFARALRGLAATFLRFAPIVCPRETSAANFRPHLKARIRARSRRSSTDSRRNCVVKGRLNV